MNAASSRWVADFAWLGDDTPAADVVIEVEGGTITRLGPASGPVPGQRLHGLVLPGLVNTHSHAFHRLLRGRTHRGGGDFWGWRDLMYELAGTLTPERYERIATAVYIEMALAGITTVGEFHYVHHQPGGAPYDDPNEMAHSLIRAARSAGLRICLLDAGYLRAGFGTAELEPTQLRFADPSAAAWLERAGRLHTEYAHDGQVSIGLAPHSVRAVPADALAEVASRRDSGPVHIHVSEQPAENDDCRAATGSTPTGLLEESGLLGANTTAIHGTHLTDGDIRTLGGSGTGVCYCATTERDLADGIGPAAALADAGSPLSVGTDSHAVIDLFEEMRGIEMHQRLATGTRGHFTPARLLTAGTTAGRRALGFAGEGLEVGAAADFIVVDTGSPRLAGFTRQYGLGLLVSAATAADVTDVFVAGDRIVSSRSHRLWEDFRGELTPPD